MTGVVEHGKGLGRTLGFPTANVRADGVSDHENGVYAGAVWVEGEALPRPAMVNQGTHPTAPGGKPTVEAHILDFQGDLYGKRVRVEYRQWLRPEQRFESLDALKAQLARDVESTRAWAARSGMTWMPADP